MNDSFYDSSSQDPAEEDYYSDKDYQTLRQPTVWSNKILAVAVAGIGLLLLGIVVVWFFFPRNTAMNTEELKILESRIAALENKFRRFDKMNEHFIRLENQTKKFAHAVDRFDQFETSVTLRMDVLAKELVALQNAKSKVKPSEPPLPQSGGKKEQKMATKYHVVKTGETLYSIGRSYGLSVDTLRQLNDLNNDITIYPGQKLVIKPGNRQ